MMKSIAFLAVCVLLGLALWWSSARDTAVPVAASMPVADAADPNHEALPQANQVQREVVVAEFDEPIVVLSVGSGVVVERAPSDSWLLRVLVVDERGLPVVDAEVSLFEGSSFDGRGLYLGRKGIKPQILTTDVGGRAEHRVLRPAAAMIASKRGLGDSNRMVVERSTAAEQAEIVLQIEPAVPLRGVVTRADGSPLSGALVATECFGICRPTRGQIVSLDDVVSDDDGRFEVAVRVGGRYRLTAKVDGESTMPAYVAIADRSPVEVVLMLPGAITVSGIVSDPNGVPVSGARVVAFREVDFAEKLEVVTDDGGGFRIPLPAHASYRVVAMASGWASGEAVVVPNAVRAHVQVGLQLQAFQAIRGRVVMAGGMSLVGATVTARPHDDRLVLGNSELDPAQRFGVPSPATSGGDGDFVLLAHPGSLFIVDAVTPGFELVRRSGVRPGGGELLLVVGATDCLIRGVVTRGDGQALPEYEVHVVKRNGPMTFSSKVEPDVVDGRFSFSSPSQHSEITVRVVPADKSLAPVAQGPFATDVAEVELSFRLLPWASVSLEVVNANARPVLGARVVINPLNESADAVGGWVDGDGRLQLERVAPGRSRLRVFPPGKHVVVREVELVPGANGALVVQLP